MNTLNNLGEAGNYFNNVFNDANIFGSYTQYTDQDGREYPAKLDYGIGLAILNATIHADTNTYAQQQQSSSAKTENTVNEIIRIAKQDYNSSQP